MKCSHTFSESITGRTPITQQIIILTTVVFYSEGYKEESVKGKDTWGKFQLNTRANFQESLPSAVTQTCLMPPATSCDNIHEMLSTKEAN